MGRSKRMVVQYATILEEPEANSRNKEKSDQATKLNLLTRKKNENVYLVIFLVHFLPLGQQK